jgi:HD-like signal output (HDOD) protein
MEDHFKIQILQNIEHIGTSPRVTANLLRLANQNDMDLNKIARLIMEEPTICAQVLKAANSAYFYRGRRISGIVNAVVHLGLDNIKKIVFAVEIIGVFNAYMENIDFNESDFWKHSLTGAMLAAEISLQNRGRDTETLYCAGLLRNIGVLAIRQFMPAEFQAIMEKIAKQALSFKRACKETLGMDHREIAYFICHRWDLPDIVNRTISEADFGISGIEIIEKNKAIINMADAILASKNFAMWDKYYEPVISTDQELADALFPAILENVNGLYYELWS